MDKKIRDFLIENSPEIEELSQKFSRYSSGITKTDVEHFISQFKPPNTYLGLKLLRHVDYYDFPDLISLARDLGENIKALTNNKLKNVLIFPLKASPTSSSYLVLKKIRQTIWTTPKERMSFFTKFQPYERLEHFSDKSSGKKIFFVDDFIGSGDTVLTSWGRIQLWQNDDNVYYVGMLVAYEDSISRIEEEVGSNLEIIVSKTLSVTKRAFHPQNKIFTPNEKKILMKYCEYISKDDEHKYGHKNGQSLVIFSDNAPNNALPILHVKRKGWKPLFLRR